MICGNGTKVDTGIHSRPASNGTIRNVQVRPIYSRDTIQLGTHSIVRKRHTIDGDVGSQRGIIVASYLSRSRSHESGQAVALHHITRKQEKDVAQGGRLDMFQSSPIHRYVAVRLVLISGQHLHLFQSDTMFFESEVYRGVCFDMERGLERSIAHAADHDTVRSGRNPFDHKLSLPVTGYPISLIRQ